MRIVNTCNFDGDYPNERFVEGLPFVDPATLQQICNLVNTAHSPRYLKVVEDDYELRPGFEP